MCVRLTTLQLTLALMTTVDVTTLHNHIAYQSPRLAATSSYVPDCMAWPSACYTCSALRNCYKQIQVTSKPSTSLRISDCICILRITGTNTSGPFYPYKLQQLQDGDMGNGGTFRTGLWIFWITKTWSALSLRKAKSSFLSGYTGSYRFWPQEVHSTSVRRRPSSTSHNVCVGRNLVLPGCHRFLFPWGRRCVHMTVAPPQPRWNDNAAPQTMVSLLWYWFPYSAVATRWGERAYGKGIKRTWRKMMLRNTLFRAAVKFNGPLLHLIYPRVTAFFGAQSRKVYQWT